MSVTWCFAVFAEYMPASQKLRISQEKGDRSLVWEESLALEQRDSNKRRSDAPIVGWWKEEEGGSSVFRRAPAMGRPRKGRREPNQATGALNVSFCLSRPSRGFLLYHLCVQGLHSAEVGRSVILAILPAVPGLAQLAFFGLRQAIVSFASLLTYRIAVCVCASCGKCAEKLLSVVPPWCALWV